jgi:hypothetical protein
MGTYDDLIDRVKAAGGTVEFSGPQASNVVDAVERSLSTSFPPSYRTFLQEYGAGGVVPEWLSGIFDNNASLNDGGTVLGDTQYFRSQYGLPPELVVIFNRDDEVVWALDTAAKRADGEMPVVSFDPHRAIRGKRIAESFSELFNQYLEVRAR